jgi:hypothetical protein
MEPRKSFLLRINPSLYRELEAWAQQEMRSVNGQIEYVLKEAVTRRRRSFVEEKEVTSEEPPSPENEGSAS